MYSCYDVGLYLELWKHTSLALHSSSSAMSPVLSCSRRLFSLLMEVMVMFISETLQVDKEKSHQLLTPREERRAAFLLCKLGQALIQTP